MDTRTEQATERVLQDELLRNERIVMHPVHGEIRLSRPTPGQERDIAEIRRKQFQNDMKNPDILSRDELMKLAERRGMWSPALSAHVEDLTRRTGEAIGLLDSIGFKDLETVIGEFKANSQALSAHFEGDEEGQAAIIRYHNLDLKPNSADRKLLLARATSSEIDDLLDTGDTIRVQIELLSDMFKIRKELRDLQERSTRIFLDSVESRTDRAEELARVYYCATKMNGEPLWASFEDIWAAKPDEVEFVLTEMYFFLHGITDDFKATLGKYGFLKRLTDTSDSSAGSPDQPPSNSAGESVESEPTPSSPATE